MPKKLSEMSLAEAEAAVSNAIYEATGLFERLEGAGLIKGNGHHIRQALAEQAVKTLRERWTIVTLHYKTQQGQSYGSESRKCSECGLMIWGEPSPVHTDDRSVWLKPPPGYVNCRTAKVAPETSKRSRIRLDSIKDPDGWAGLHTELGLSEEQIGKHFTYGEFADIEIEVNQDLQIVGGRILPKR